MIRLKPQLIGALLLLWWASPLTVRGQLRFQDVSETAGLLVDDPGQGVSVADYDGDGWEDLFVGAKGRPALFRNAADGSFTNVSEAAGIHLEGNYPVSVWADLDNDDDPDLVVGGYGSDTAVFENRGDGTFIDVSVSSGIDLQLDAVALAAGDFDLDGAVDLFVAVDRSPDMLYRNRGDGTFEDVSGTSATNGSDISVAMQAMWFDYDHDGWPDLFAVHDGDTPSRVHRNRGYLPLVDEGTATGFADVGAGNSMGLSWGDVDGDGWEDVYVTRIGSAGLYRNRGDGTFDMVEDAAGAERNGMSWGTVMQDFDHDLDPDLFIVNTSGYDGTPSLLYDNVGGHFVDVSSAAGASLSLDAQGLASFDFDRDGLLDLVFPTFSGQIRLLRGTPTGAGNWLRLRLKGETANRMAIGARVQAQVNGVVVSGYVSGGDSFCSQSSPVIHLGLGSATEVERVTVYWGGDSIESFHGLAAGTEHVLVQGTATGTNSERLFPKTPTAPEVLTVVAYPNPATDRATITLSLELSAQTSILLYDMLGREVRHIHDGFVRVGQTEFEVFTGDLPAGLYFVHTVSMESQRSSPFLVNH